MLPRKIDKYIGLRFYIPWGAEPAVAEEHDRRRSTIEANIVRNGLLDAAHDIGTAIMQAEITSPGSQEIDGEVDVSKY